jgi:hypothetical protein
MQRVEHLESRVKCQSRGKKEEKPRMSDVVVLEPASRGLVAAPSWLHSICMKQGRNTMSNANEHPARGVRTAQKRKHPVEYLGDHLPHAMLELPPPASPGPRLIN